MNYRCGHLRTPENSRARSDKPGQYRCLTCRRQIELQSKRKARGKGLTHHPTDVG